MATIKKNKVIKKVIKAKKTSEVSLYSASIKIFGKSYYATGLTLKEALESLKPEGKTGGICILSVTHGDKKMEKILNASQLFKLFTASRVIHEMALKNILMLFGDI